MKLPESGDPRYFRDYPVLSVYRESIWLGLLLTVQWPFMCYLEWAVEHSKKKLDE